MLHEIKSETRTEIPLKVNPLSSFDYLVELPYISEKGVAIVIRYVPDNDLFDESFFKSYCQELLLNEERSEKILKRLHHDFNNEVIPHFLQIEVQSENGVRLVIEDKRPGWENQDFMRRLKRF